MIPKLIHYCWFGRSALPSITRKCIQSWKKFLSDYEIIEWNEDNFDINKAPEYVKEAYSKGKYAFVSDYVRLYALQQHGGIYMDTDLEVKKSLNPFLNLPAFLSFETDSLISTALIASQKDAKWITELLEQYNYRRFIQGNGKLDYTTNVETITNFLINKGLQIDGKEQNIKGEICIYPQWYFSNSKGKKRKEIYAIHHFSASWHSPIVRFLEIFLPAKTVQRIASYKEKVLKIFKHS